ncbi:Unknown protein sequence [Pseudomonas syringae pv. berberidis]|nr:Unknown protein sequence [Pseudomonas syringae pv. berberidis]
MRFAQLVGLMYRNFVPAFRPTGTDYDLVATQLLGSARKVAAHR